MADAKLAADLGQLLVDIRASKVARIEQVARLKVMRDQYKRMLDEEPQEEEGPCAAQPAAKPNDIEWNTKLDDKVMTERAAGRSFKSIAKDLKCTAIIVRKRHDRLVPKVKKAKVQVPAPAAVATPMMAKQPVPDSLDSQMEVVRDMDKSEEKKKKKKEKKKSKRDEEIDIAN